MRFSHRLTQYKRLGRGGRRIGPEVVLPRAKPDSARAKRLALALHGSKSARRSLEMEISIELATELGLLDGDIEQIVDSTLMLGAAAIQDTVHLVRAAVRKLLDAVKAANASAARQLTASLKFDYARPREKPAGDWHDKPTRETLLVDVATDAQRALRAVEDDPHLVADETVGEATRLLAEIVGQEFDTTDDEDVPRPRHGRQTRQIISAHDPEMRHGRKTNARRFTGYKLHAATATKTPLLTAIAISPGNEHDGHHAAALVEQQPARRRPTRVIGDTATATSKSANSSSNARSECSRHCISPAPTTRAPSTRTASRSTSRRRPLPAQGQDGTDLQAPSQRAAADGTRVARFTPNDCEPCPLRERCAPNGRRQVRVHRREDLRQPRYENSPIPSSSVTSNASDHASSGSSVSSSTATTAARVDIAEPEKRRCRPSGPPSWSTCTRSELPYEGRPPEAAETTDPNQPRRPARPPRTPHSTPTFQRLVEKRSFAMGAQAPATVGASRGGSGHQVVTISQMTSALAATAART